MNKQINQLVTLALAYAAMGEKAHLPLNQNNELSGTYYTKTPLNIRPDGRHIRLYFGDKYTTWAVYFGTEGFEIAGYSKRVTLPFEFTTAQLQEVIDDATAFLTEFTGEHMKTYEAFRREQIAGEIAKLNAKIETLKTQADEIAGNS